MKKSLHKKEEIKRGLANRAGKIASISIIIAALAACMLFVIACSNGAAATLDGQAISEEEVTDQIAILRKTAQYEDDAAFAGALAAQNMTPEALRESEIERLAQNIVLAQMAKEQGIEANQQQVDAQLAQMEQQYGGEEGFAQTLEKAGFSLEEYKNELATQSLRIQIRDAIEIAPASQAEQDKYIQENAATYDGQKSSHILFESGDKKHAEEVLKAILKGANFAKTAQKESIDTVSAEDGGNIGWSSAGNLDTTYLDALKKLSVGEVTSKLVETQFGLHIIKCTAEFKAPKNPEKLKLSNVPDEIKQQLLDDMVKSAQEANLNSTLAEKLSEEHLKINPMPENLPYDVDMNLASQAPPATTETPSTTETP